MCSVKNKDLVSSSNVIIFPHRNHFSSRHFLFLDRYIQACLWKRTAKWDCFFLLVLNIVVTNMYSEDNRKQVEGIQCTTAQSLLPTSCAQFVWYCGEYFAHSILKVPEPTENHRAGGQSAFQWSKGSKIFKIYPNSITHLNIETRLLVWV